MDRMPVKSGHIESVGYENGVMEVAFKGGLVWQYKGITPEAHAEIMDSDSIGGAINARVRDESVVGMRLEPEIFETVGGMGAG